MSRCPSSRTNALRVGFVTPGMSCGGAERWCLTLAKHFSSAVQISGFVTGGRGALTKEAEKIATVYHPLQSEFMLAKSDVLIAWGWEHLTKMTENFQGRIIAVSHGEPGGDWQDKVTTAMAKTPRVELVGVSFRSLDAWPNRGTGVFIPNGVEVDRVTPRFGRAAIRQSLGIEAHQKMALFLGRLSPEKRPWLMHEMIPYLSKEWVSVICGPDMAGYNIGMAGKERVLCLPPVERPGDLLSAADMFVLPSETEAHPLSLTEAWMAGVPTVYCNWPFAQQIKSEWGVNLGTVVPVDLTAERLAKAVEKINPDMLRRTNLARNIAWDHYTASAMAGRWEQILFAPALENATQSAIAA